MKNTINFPTTKFANNFKRTISNWIGRRDHTDHSPMEMMVPSNATECHLCLVLLLTHVWDLRSFTYGTYGSSCLELMVTHTYD